MRLELNIKLLIALFIIFLGTSASFAQQQTLELIWQNYDAYKEPALRNRLFKHSDLLPLLKKHVDRALLHDEVISTSVNGHTIHHLSTGNGKIKVLLWSQMHGDESTATMALFDLFNFLSANDQYNPVRKRLLDQLELHFIPMLNPDGAQIWTRRNAMNIDLNRDAQNLATPEARALMEMGKKLDPQFGFNLHDQSIYYTAGKASQEPATVSFLAPAFNDAKDMNATRTKAVQLITAMNRAIQTKIPNKVAKYNDSHDASCFGDTFQAMGISTILIESGGYPDDQEKQYIRKINFYALLTALNAIADESYLKEPINNYWALPNNSRNLNDLIIRNLSIHINNQPIKTDLAINQVQKISADFLTIDYFGSIVKTGRLDSAYAYHEIDAEKLLYSPGKIKYLTQLAWAALKPNDEIQLIKDGYLFVKWTDGTSPIGPIKNRLLNLTNHENDIEIAGGNPANFILAENNKPAFAVINGFLITLSAPANTLINTMGY